MKWYFDPEQRLYWSLGDGDDEIFLRQDFVQGNEMAAIMSGVSLDGIEHAEVKPVPRLPADHEVRGAS
ncbi:MAG: hypothetical protein K1X87_06710 [Dehalococcoidia bacterium]|nr:hypothetical protein [Dehalococcoidia bacterium]HRC62007.1 hypothetical protein [Dehalococcoidia bacterium]